MASSSLVSYETLVHAISGACGSVSAMAVTVPLDTARTRLLLDPAKRSKGTIAVLMELIREEGVLTLFRGMRSTLQSVAVSNFVYFYAFHGLKQLIGGPPAKQTATKDLAFACLAGTVNVLLTNPLWVVNSRIKMQGTSKALSDQRSHYKGLIDGLIRLAKEEGLPAVWSGTLPSLVLVSNPAIKFSVYEMLKRRALEWLTRPDGGQLGQHGQQLSAGQAFLIGVLASLAATVATYPVQVLQTKSRHGHGLKNLKKDANMLELGSYILRNFGVGYLYQGLDAKLLQSVIAAGFMFLTYEKLASLIFAAFGVQNHARIKAK